MRLDRQGDLSRHPAIRMELAETFERTWHPVNNTKKEAVSDSA